MTDHVCKDLHDAGGSAWLGQGAERASPDAKKDRNPCPLAIPDCHEAGGHSAMLVVGGQWGAATVFSWEKRRRIRCRVQRGDEPVSVGEVSSASWLLSAVVAGRLFH